MRDLGSRLGGEQGRCSRIAKEIEDARPLAFDSRQPLQHPIPMRILLGKESEMPKARELAKHRDSVDADRPGIGHTLVDTPLAFLVVLAGGRKDRMRLRPFRFRKMRPPQRLRLRPIHDDGAEALQFAPGAAIEKGIVRETVGRDELEAIGRHRQREFHKKSFDSRGFSTNVPKWQAVAAYAINACPNPDLSLASLRQRVLQSRPWPFRSRAPVARVPPQRLPHG